MAPEMAILVRVRVPAIPPGPKYGYKILDGLTIRYHVCWHVANSIRARTAALTDTSCRGAYEHRQYKYSHYVFFRLVRYVALRTGTSTLTVDYGSD
eukprot:scaffold292885_cov28-Prasinocladus_malaysianus.AAC.1